ncbi:MAG TPA: OB-fold nucleic acid binding domain-containing protein, partial [Solirubrobacteraceae bacterium]|nr:OB-fold nucleic acid binding domain-containing protein [Solirubrobacteraceae bacterium]
MTPDRLTSATARRPATAVTAASGANGSTVSPSGSAGTISTLRPGADVNGVFACTRKDRLSTRTGSPYLALELRDATGTIPARAFREADALAGRFERGDLVRVSGRVERFRDELVLEIMQIERADPGAAGADPAD